MVLEPQGSVVGPKLFILYINDICNVSQLLKFVLFADDTTILYSGAYVHWLRSVVNCELDKILYDDNYARVLVWAHYNVWYFII